MEINNAVVMVTGASSGIGEATARAADQAGARVVLLARRKERIDAIAAEFTNALTVACDVTRADEVHAAVSVAKDRFGRIDALVNNAGQGLYASVEDIGIADFRDVLDLNLVTPLVMMQAVIPLMRSQGAGSIVNVSSGATLGIYPGSAAYTSSKSALNMLSSVARLELADAGIVVSVMQPSMTGTEFYGSVKSGAEEAKAQESIAAAFVHSPDLVAEAILALIRSGDAQADLVPEAYGGSFKG